MQSGSITDCISYIMQFKFVLFVLSHADPRKVSCMVYVKFPSYHMRRKAMLTTTLAMYVLHLYRLPWWMTSDYKLVLKTVMCHSQQTYSSSTAWLGGFDTCTWWLTTLGWYGIPSEFQPWRQGHNKLKNLQHTRSWTMHKTMLSIHITCIFPAAQILPHRIPNAMLANAM